MKYRNRSHSRQEESILPSLILTGEKIVERQECQVPEGFKKVDTGVYFKHLLTSYNHSGAIAACKESGGDGLAKIKSLKEKNAILDGFNGLCENVACHILFSIQGIEV